MIRVLKLYFLSFFNVLIFICIPITQVDGVATAVREANILSLDAPLPIIWSITRWGHLSKVTEYVCLWYLCYSANPILFIQAIDIWNRGYDCLLPFILNTTTGAYGANFKSLQSILKDISQERREDSRHLSLLIGRTLDQITTFRERLHYVTY